MSERVDRIVIGLMVVFTLTGFAAVAFMEDGRPREIIEVDPIPPIAASSAEAVAWFSEIRRYCNPVEVDTRLRFDPAPATDDGTMYMATCYGLAGKIEQARAKLLELPEELRWRGAGVVFEAAHPAADAGDELAAGPLMELVVEFWPNHYMALYHAGAAAYQRGEPESAKGYLERFLAEYDVEDGWTRSARGILAEIG